MTCSVTHEYCRNIHYLFLVNMNLIIWKDFILYISTFTGFISKMQCKYSYNILKYQVNSAINYKSASLLVMCTMGHKSMGLTADIFLHNDQHFVSNTTYSQVQPQSWVTLWRMVIRAAGTPATGMLSTSDTRRNTWRVQKLSHVENNGTNP